MVCKYFGSNKFPSHLNFEVSCLCNDVLKPVSIFIMSKTILPDAKIKTMK